MADLKVPERCALCGEPFQEGDKIAFIRRATLRYPITFHMETDPASPDFRTWVEKPNRNRPLQPRVEAHPIRHVTHLDCPGERLGG